MLTVEVNNKNKLRKRTYGPEMDSRQYRAKFVYIYKKYKLKGVETKFTIFTYSKLGVRLRLNFEAPNSL